MQDSWTVNDAFVAVKNPNYWAHGRRRQPAARTSTRSRTSRSTDGRARLNSLEGGEFDVIHTSGSLQIERDPGAGRAGHAEERRVRRVRRGRLHDAERRAGRRSTTCWPARSSRTPSTGRRSTRSGPTTSRPSRRDRSHPATSATSRTPAIPSTTPSKATDLVAQYEAGDRRTARVHVHAPG